MARGGKKKAQKRRGSHAQDDYDDSSSDDGLTAEEMEHLFFEHLRARAAAGQRSGKKGGFIAFFTQLLAELLRRAYAWLNVQDAGAGASSRAGAPPPREEAEDAPAGVPTLAAAFDLLGVAAAEATPESVRSAFRKLSLLCHPDKCSGDATAPRRFAALVAARDAALAHLSGGAGASGTGGAGGAGYASEEREDAARYASDAAARRARKAEEAAQRRAGEAQMDEERAAMQREAAQSQQRQGRSRERAAWEADVRERERFFQESYLHPQHRGKKRKGRPPPAPQTEASRRAARAAAEDAVGPPPAPRPPATPEQAYADCLHPLAVAIRARATIHFTGVLHVARMSGELRDLLTEDFGAGTTALHHAARADWSEGVQTIVLLAAAGYESLVSARDDGGATPADAAPAGSAVARRLEELAAHALEAATARKAVADAQRAALRAALCAAPLRIVTALCLAPLRVAAALWRAAYSRYVR
jgi:hypothetical protein